MIELKEIAKNYGLSMKELAIMSTIKYTTLISMSKTPLTHWSDNHVNAIELALSLNKGQLFEIIRGETLVPFIKWVGGKRQLLPQLKAQLPKNYNRYFEPFIGGGALFLSEKPHNAVINDFNTELTNVWNVVKENADGLSLLLKEHERNDSKEYYLDIRSADRDGRIVNMTANERAARFIYMNKAGYNGLWRVNLKGQNNVPYGAHSKLNLINDNLFNVSQYLNENNIQILNGDYRKAVEEANTGDFVYFDPPYIPIDATSSFTSYTENGFGLVQQQQLRDTAIELSKKGVLVMLSNSDVPLIYDLYKEVDGFFIQNVQATRMINSNGKKRGKIGEVIITNY